MNYRETIDYLMSALPMYQRIGAAAYKATLDTSRALDLYDGSPHAEYPTVHVGGTNGKGSVAHMLASVLMAAGYKTGLFTSPHLLDFRERIRVNGEKVSQEFVAEYISSRKDFFDEIQPSFFEMSAAMAFSYFAQEEVDIAIIEVGMGGRLDSTNIIQPALSVITNIGFDHMLYLGETLRAIASEKAGIIKSNTPLVIGSMPQEAKRVCIEKARSVSAPFQVSSELWSCQNSDTTVGVQKLSYVHNPSGDLLTVETDLLGNVQRENIPVALCAVDYLKQLGFAISQPALLKGLRSVRERTQLRGRWEHLSNSPCVICDTGHNQDGIRRIVEQLEGIEKNTLHAVVGFVNDKDVSNLLALLPRDATYYFTQASVPRALEVEKLAEEAHTVGLNGQPYPTVQEAVKQALAAASPSDLVFIGGSTFVVADALTMEW